MKKIENPLKNRTVFGIIITILSTTTLALSLLAVSYSLHILLMPEYIDIVRLYGSLTFAFLSLTHACTAIKLWKEKRRYLFLFYSVMYLLIMTFFAIYGLNIFAHRVLFASFFAINIAGRCISVVFDHRKRNIVVAILFIIIHIVFLSLTINLEADMTIYETIGLLVISFYCIGYIITEALAKIHLKQLTKIIRKTYALEILLGLVSLIVAFSFVFMIMDNMS